MKSAKLGPLWWVLACCVVLGLAVMGAGKTTAGGDIVAAGLIVAMVGRALLSSDRAVGAAVRSRWTDVGMYAFLAVMLIVFVHQLRTPFHLPT